MIEPNTMVYMNDQKLWVRSWGIDRIDQIDLPLDNLYKPLYRGTTSHVYIIDSGIRKNHVEFKNKIRNGFSALSDNSSPYDDCNGHGTHVAGTAAGRTAGVAKGANFIQLESLVVLEERLLMLLLGESSGLLPIISSLLLPICHLVVQQTML